MKAKEPLAHILVLFLLAPAWGGSGDLEITPGEQQTFQKTIRINNFRKFINSEEEFISKYIEAFPGKKIAFIITALP